MNLVDLDTFVRVARTGSLTGAAEELGVPKSTVSRRVVRLEDELGVALVHRTGRSVVLTERGLHLATRSAPALAELAAAERSLGDLDSEPAGMLRLTAPGDLGTSELFSRMLVDFRARWPKVTLEIELTDRFVDLLQEGFDLAIRPGVGPIQWGAEGLKTRAVGALSGGLFAAPSYLAGRPALTHPNGSEDHDWVVHRAFHRREVQLVHRGTGEGIRLQRAPVVITNHLHQVFQFVHAGSGVGMVPTFLAHTAVMRGELVSVLDEWRLPPGKIWAVWPETRHQSPRLRAFLDHITAAFAELPNLQ